MVARPPESPAGLGGRACVAPIASASTRGLSLKVHPFMYGASQHSDRRDWVVSSATGHQRLSHQLGPFAATASPVAQGNMLFTGVDDSHDSAKVKAISADARGG